MSQGNGHSRSNSGRAREHARAGLPQLQEQLAEAQARRDLAQAQAEAALWESTLGGMGGFGPSFSDWLNPYQYRYDDFGRAWLPLGAGQLHGRQDGRNRPFAWTDFDLDGMRYW